VHAIGVRSSVLLIHGTYCQQLHTASAALRAS